MRAVNIRKLETAMDTWCTRYLYQQDTLCRSLYSGLWERMDQQLRRQLKEAYQ